MQAAVIHNGLENSPWASSPKVAGLDDRDVRDPLSLLSDVLARPGPMPPQVRSTRARLHKKAASPANRSSTEVQAPSSSVSGPAAIPPLSVPPSSHLVSDSDLVATQRVSSKPRGEQLRKNLRRLTQHQDATQAGTAETQTQLDLSLTAAENEERTGITISSPTVRFPDIPDSSNEARAFDTQPTPHQRSTSHTSNSSTNISSSFKPTVPFVHPIHQSARPTMPISHSTSYSSECSADQTRRPRGESAASAHTNRTRDTSDSYSHRPALRVNTSNQSSIRGSVSATPTVRSRRGTNLSSTSRPDMPSPDILFSPSRASLDRAFSFMRRDTEPLDPATRAASIQAARQAFDDREEAKARKHERQERKAAERREQSAVKAEERRRRRQSDAIEKKNALEAEGQRVQAEADYAQQEKIVNQPIPERTDGIATGAAPEIKASRIRARQSGNGPKFRPSPSAGGRVKDKPMFHSPEDVHFPRVSRKRAAKSTFFTFWTWFKTRLLRLGLFHH